jgi:protein-tyrosine phosphatase
MKNFAALAALLAVFGGCYQEVELDPRQPGDTLPIAGAYNVRDAGGYPAAGGKTVKTGLLYRSGDLNRLFPRDEAYLYGELGIKTVVDFRSKKHKTGGSNAAPSEREENPGKYWSGVAVKWKDTAIDESVIVPDYGAIIEDSAKTVDGVIDDVKNGYKNIVLGSFFTPSKPDARDQYNAFFRILLEAEGPVLFHCSAGKDRTGVAAALLLSALGVERETVIQDYLLSAQYVADKYYPVVPYVVRHTRDSLTAGQTQAQQALGGIQAGAGEQVKAGIKSGIEKGVKDGVIAGVKAGLVDSGAKTLEAANAMSEAEVNTTMGSQLETQVQAVIKQQGGSDDFNTALNNMVEARLAQMQAIAAMTDAQIEGQAQDAGQKIAPLVTVRREYIEAMFAAIDGKYSGASASDKVIAYLTDGTNGLGLTQDQIDRLKAKYLE